MVAQTMAQNILDGLQLRVQHVRSLLDHSQNVEAPVALLDVQESLRASVALRDYLSRVCKLLWTDAFDNRIDDYENAGHLCLSCFDAALKTFAAVSERAKLVVARSHPDDARLRFEEDFAVFEQAVNQVAQSRKDFAERWPWVRSELLEKSLAEHGQRKSVKRLFDELRHRNRQVS